MDIALDRPGDYLFVRRADAHAVTVVDQEFSRSLLLAPDRLVEDWPVRDAAALEEGDAASILALAPEVVLLGTGARQVFPQAAFMARFLRAGIGVEAMDNPAAARTYGLLAGEGRRVVVAFILG